MSAGTAALTATVPGQRREPVGVASAGAVVVSKAARRFVPCASELPRLMVPETEQSVSSTRGRLVLDPYTWKQAVHWVVGSGLYVPDWEHGPKEMGRSTVLVAQELAALSPCRPGVDYLMRKLRLSERTVQNHLRMLRESGLLVYVAKGTRVRGEKPQASEFALVIPPQFDAALGIRTVGEGSRRRVVGIAEAGRAVMALLGKRASRKVRATRAKSAPKSTDKGPVTAAQATAGPVPAQLSQAAESASGADCRCTPMGGGCSSFSADGSSHLPPESKLASGKPKSTSAKKSTKAGRGARKLNRVGRRYQLASELVRQVPWLRRALVPRVAWVIREVADAGWTDLEVIAWLTTTSEPTRGSWRPTGLLASRLHGVTAMPGWTTPTERARAVERWRDSRAAEHARHDRTNSTDDWSLTDWQTPRSNAASRLASQAFDQLLHPDDRDARPLEFLAQTEDGLLDLQRLDQATALQLVKDAEADPYLITLALQQFGEHVARQLYTDDLVDQHLRLRHTSGHLALLRPWEIA
ncbi:helix-turn-helix domain-containing protein [Kitasatospora sp. RB6PN24]|uniref:helix-turn-helix domain-containing protein n=1 Tax=Kitasatospora humi TaxID=2893891 RepID=UPI001E56675A|nr:helix-turn-helix domain-containing protein [Kitasatospora humi]MCC9312351.1 helix-turn-helix domain-containing protein [Kitasatospora humi]